MAVTAIVDLTVDVKPYLGIPSGDTSHDTMLQTVIDGCTRVVENLAGPVVNRQYDEWHDGGHARIALRHRPVVNVIAVTEYQGPTPFPLVQVDSPASASMYSFQSDPDGWVLRRTAGGGTVAFPPGSATVRVLYVAGRLATDVNLPNIKLGTLELIRLNWQPTQQAGRPQLGGTGTGGNDLPATTILGFFVPNRVRELVSPSRRHPRIF